MRKVELFIALSLDGYIADAEGKVDWLHGESQEVSDYDFYTPFIKNIDTIIIGRNTYDQIVKELSPDHWPYYGLKTYVITHEIQQCRQAADIIFTGSELGSLIKQLKQESGKDIWICGGADLIQQLMSENLIEVFHFCIIPVILGHGIRLFKEMEQHIDLSLIGTTNYNGIIEVVCKRK